MKILIGCDVDPTQPEFLSQTSESDIWRSLEEVERLRTTANGYLPPITWLIRSDESVRLATGRFDSGYVSKRGLWEGLRADGHELGWHMHLTSYDRARGCFGLDSDPPWLSHAHAALAAHFPVNASRTGWDYCNDTLMRRLDGFGIRVDFSALPGSLAWHKIGYDWLCVDWSRCPSDPYHPSENDYQRAGGLNIWEFPNTQFVNPWVRVPKRMAWRWLHGATSLRGMRSRSKLLTAHWDTLPTLGRWAVFYFHPEDLPGEGMPNLLRNIELLSGVPGAQFTTASEVMYEISEGELGAQSA